MPGLKGKVIVTDETICSEGLRIDPKGENEVILSTTKLDVNAMELLYAVICNENNLIYQHVQLCEHAHISQKNLRCQYLPRYNPHCPCEKFQYSKKKGKTILQKYDNFILQRT